MRKDSIERNMLIGSIGRVDAEREKEKKNRSRVLFFFMVSIKRFNGSFFLSEDLTCISFVIFSFDLEEVLHSIEYHH